MEKTVAEAVNQYLSLLEEDQRATAQQEMNRFVWWFGSGRRLSELDARAVESYQAQVEASGADTTRRLEPLKTFLAYCQTNKWTAANLAKCVRLRKVGTAKRHPRGGASGVGMSEAAQFTREGYEQKKRDLDHLVNVERPKVSHDILEARRDKDIRENAAYDAAKQHQALVEARIRDLERVLGDATIIGESQGSEKVSVGAAVVVRDLVREVDLRYTVVSPGEVDSRHGKISSASPVGKALLDTRVGDTVEVSVPAGVLRYRVERIEG